MTKFLVSLALLLAGFAATSQTALDPTQSGAYPAYPFYLDHSCGGVKQSQYEERANADGTVTGAFKFITTCPTGGRGTRPKVFESCWAVTFAADRYSVIAQDLLLYATWRIPALPGQPAVACPAL